MNNNYLHQHLDLKNAFLISDAKVFKKLPSPIGVQRSVLTAYGRNAIYLGLTELSKLTTKKEILVPSYSCGDEIQAVLCAGFSIKPYSIKFDLSIDMKMLEKQISKKTAGILVTHFFGIPCEQMDMLEELRKKHKLFLIEDCAHALGSKVGDKYVGTTGDISVFSLRKFYPIPHGGALVINNPKIKIPSTKHMQNEAIEKDFAVFLGYRSGLLHAGMCLSDQVLNKGNFNRHGARLEEYGGYELGISNTAKYFLSISRKFSVNKRQNLFRKYAKFFVKRKDIYPLINEIQDGVNPLYFPLVVDNSEQVAERLRKFRDVFTQPFWSFKHEYIDWNLFPEAKQLKEKILVLPLHLELEEKLINKLLEIV